MMGSLSPQPVEECLDVAVDHRLRALFRSISKSPRPNIVGRHGQQLAELARVSTHRIISEHEINVMNQFLGPGYTGGITFILLQPSNYHPYQEGFDSVVLNCLTFTFMDEGFRAASCGSIGLGSPPLSLVDSAPYIRPNDSVSVEYKYNMRQSVSRIIREKKPDVVLCMWKDEERGQRRPLTMAQVRSLGVGRDFNTSRISFAGIPMERVNSFHPSYAANYNPHVSCFRQLLLLNITEACWMYEYGTWHEEQWMKDLKNRCVLKASSISATDKRLDNLLEEIYLCLNTHLHWFSNLQYIIDHLEVQLNQIQEFIISWTPNNGGAEGHYTSILQSQVSEHFNDASLCLQQLWCRDVGTDSDDVSPDDGARIAAGGRKCLQLLRTVISRLRVRQYLRRSRSSGYYEPSDLVKSLERCNMAGRFGSPEVSATVRNFLESLNMAFQRTKVQNEVELRVELWQVSRHFLAAALGFEKMLSQLLKGSQGTSDLESLEKGVGNLAVK